LIADDDASDGSIPYEDLPERPKAGAEGDETDGDEAEEEE
jgi:hypothetical protein